MDKHKDRGVGLVGRKNIQGFVYCRPVGNVERVAQGGARYRALGYKVFARRTRVT